MLASTHTNGVIHPCTLWKLLYNRNVWCNLWGAAFFAWGNVSVREGITDDSWPFCPLHSVDLRNVGSNHILVQSVWMLRFSRLFGMRCPSNCCPAAFAFHAHRISLKKYSHNLSTGGEKNSQDRSTKPGNKKKKSSHCFCEFWLQFNTFYQVNVALQ